MTISPVTVSGADELSLSPGSCGGSGEVSDEVSGETPGKESGEPSGEVSGETFGDSFCVGATGGGEVVSADPPLAQAYNEMSMKISRIAEMSLFMSFIIIKYPNHSFEQLTQIM